MRWLKLAFGISLVGLIGSAAILISLLIVGRTPRRVESTPLTALDPPALGETAPASLRVLLLRSAETAAYFGASPGASEAAYDQRIADWEQRLRRAGHSVERVHAGTLRGAGPRRTRGGAPTVIVAPSAAALDDAAVAGLLHAVKHGTGLVATWQLAVHQPGGAWRGYGPLRRLIGARALGDAGALGGQAPRYLALHDGTALTAGLPAGGRIEVQPFDQPLLVTSSFAVADWVRWEMLPFGPPGAPLYPTAVARRRCGRGRVAWLDFEPSAAIPGGSGPAWLDALVDNAVRWTGGVPGAGLETWPRGARVAAVIALDAEHEFPKAGGVARVFADAGVPLTTFAVSRLAEEHPEVVTALAHAGEVNSHTHDHLPLAGADAAIQRDQLERSRAILASLSGQPVLGFRPPEEQMDATTLGALVASGYHFVAGDTHKDRTEPWTVAVDGGTLVVLPRIPFDDYEFMVRQPLRDPARVWAAMRSDFRHLERLGGLYLFDFHTQYSANPAIHVGVEHLLGLRQTPHVWFARAGDVAEWWRLRAGAAVRIERTDATGLTVAVASAAPAEELAARVYLPDQVAGVHVSAASGPLPLVARQDGTEPVLRLSYRDLAPGEIRRTRLDLRSAL